MSERGLIAIAEAILALANAISTPKEPRKRARSEKTQPPRDLSLEDKRALKDWAQREEPWAVPKLRELVDEMLGWHRAEGRSRVSWYAAAQNWVKTARTRYGQ